MIYKLKNARALQVARGDPMTAMQPLLITGASDLSSYDSCGI
jgi:hypothetical protein